MLTWAVGALRKAGTLAIIGVYPPTAQTFPIGAAMNKNLSLRSGNCNHRKYLWDAVSWVKTGRLSPERLLTQLAPVSGAIEAYEAFDRRAAGWLKVEVVPGATGNGVQTIRGDLGSKSRRRTNVFQPRRRRSGRAGHIRRLLARTASDPFYDRAIARCYRRSSALIRSCRTVDCAHRRP